jgi:TolB-like protein
MTAADPPVVVDLARAADFRLGELAIHPARREVGDGAARKLLEPRVMQVLVALARRAGDVVSRDDLIASCWNGRIVGEDAISACVAKVRRLGESSGAYAIETIPRVGYRLEPRGEPAARVAASSGEDVVLAVLPFENLSGDPELSYFSDGVSEEILNALAQRADLKVIGRSSSFQLRGPDKAIPNVARVLGASHALDGAVRRGGVRTRISAQLIDCATQATLWADRFEGELTDIFALQDEVAGAVSRAMQCALAPAVRSGAVDVTAYDLYLKARAPPPDLTDAYARQIELLEQAVERAPAFADAWGYLGYVRASSAYFLSTEVAEPLRASAQEAARRALGLDPRCALAAAAMARSIPGFDDVAEHAAWLDRALEWGPNDVIVTRLHSRLLASVGRLREALAAIRRAARLHPLDLQIATMVGRALVENGALGEAIAVLLSLKPRFAEFQLGPLWLGVALTLNGEPERAGQVLLNNDLGPYANTLANIIDLYGRPNSESGHRAMDHLRRQARGEGRVTLDNLIAAAELGDAGEALDIALQVELGPSRDAPNETGGAASNMALLFTHGSPKIRRIPRFVRLCARLGLVTYWIERDAWPDCVAEVAPYYDFKAECLRVSNA